MLYGQNETKSVIVSWTKINCEQLLVIVQSSTIHKSIASKFETIKKRKLTVLTVLLRLQQYIKRMIADNNKP